MRILYGIITSIILFYSNSLQSQELDSLLTYTFSEGGEISIGAKSYWNYDSDLNVMKSSYYIYSTDESKFIHINDQLIKYFANTRMFEIFETIDYGRSQVDSTIYKYNSDQINIEKVKYVGKLGADQNMTLSRIEKYLCLDHTNRKTNEVIDVIREGEIVRTSF